jgi:hypothetical protein
VPASRLLVRLPSLRSSRRRDSACRPRRVGARRRSGRLNRGSATPAPTSSAAAATPGRARHPTHGPAPRGRPSSAVNHARPLITRRRLRRLERPRGRRSPPAPPAVAATMALCRPSPEPLLRQGGWLSADLIASRPREHGPPAPALHLVTSRSGDALGDRRDERLSFRSAGEVQRNPVGYAVFSWLLEPCCVTRRTRDLRCLVLGIRARTRATSASSRETLSGGSVAIARSGSSAGPPRLRERLNRRLCRRSNGRVDDLPSLRARSTAVEVPWSNKMPIDARIVMCRPCEREWWATQSRVPSDPARQGRWTLVESRVELVEAPFGQEARCAQRSCPSRRPL